LPPKTPRGRGRWGAKPRRGGSRPGSVRIGPGSVRIGPGSRRRGRPPPPRPCSRCGPHEAGWFSLGRFVKPTALTRGNIPQAAASPPYPPTAAISQIPSPKKRRAGRGVRHRRVILPKNPLYFPLPELFHGAFWHEDLFQASSLFASSLIALSSGVFTPC